MREQYITTRKAVHMIFRRLAYGFKEGLKNIFRNKIFSLATVGTIMACIFLLGVTFSVLLNVRATVKQAEDSVTITYSSMKSWRRAGRMPSERKSKVTKKFSLSVLYRRKKHGLSIKKRYSRTMKIFWRDLRAKTR